MEKPSFVYSTYVRTTPETLWRALTEPEFTRRYWGNELHSDWTVGSPITWLHRGVTIADPEQVVLEYDPYRRLAYSWHAMTPELASSVGLSDEVRDAAAAEPRSKVSFELEGLGEVVKLTVVHDGFTPDSTMLSLISNGWPYVLSDLKTLLETGEVMPRADAPVPPARA